MSGVVDVCVVDVLQSANTITRILGVGWCGGYLVWWMSGVVDVCVVDVVQSIWC